MELHIFLTHLVNSYKRFTNEDLVQPTGSLIQSINKLDSPVLSHQKEKDPIINFANTKALELWETTFEDFTKTPSRLTAEKMLQSTRQSFLDDVKKKWIHKRISWC